MRRLWIGLLGVTALPASLLLAPTAGQAQTYPWCAVYGGEDGGGTNCGFVTLEQCRATIMGMGGFCAPNQFYSGPAAKPGRRVRKRNRD